MRNDRPEGRREKGGRTCRAYVKPVGARVQHTLEPAALVVLDFGETTYRRLTPENAERVARELLEAAKAARELLAGAPRPPGPPEANAAALRAA